MQPGYVHGPAFDTDFLKVTDIHELYYAQYGNPNGKPVVFLHGGPGGYTSHASTIYFNPEVYRVVLFDQRGSGKSRPSSELHENTSPHLIADVEKLRNHLQIPKWHVVFGGSWGSALALMYAQAYPEVTGSLVLRGIFTGRAEEVDFHHGKIGAANLYPDAYKSYVDLLPQEDRHDPTRGYYKMLLQEDSELRRKAAYQFNHWGFTTNMISSDKMEWWKLDDPVYSYTHALLECHYFAHGLFMEEGELLRAENVDKIRHIPGAIIHGRYDICCPPKTAWDLHQKWPEAALYMIPNAGHAVLEEGIHDKLIEVCDAFATLGSTPDISKKPLRREMALTQEITMGQDAPLRVEARI